MKCVNEWAIHCKVRLSFVLRHVSEPVAFASVRQLWGSVVFESST